MTLITEHCPEYQSLSVGFWLKAGTRHEKPSEAGICHFLEHMLFKGTKKRNAFEIARDIDRVGGDLNAFTTREYTCFHITLLSKDADVAFEILNDMILNSTFDSEELERERKVILQELSMVEDSPEEFIHDLLFEKVYGKLGLGKPILGVPRSVKNIKRSHLLNFFKSEFKPEKLIVTVAGDLTHRAAAKLIKPLLKSKNQWPGRNDRKTSPKKDLGLKRNTFKKTEFQSHRLWLHKPIEQTHVMWAMPACSLRSHERLPMALLNAHLGVGMSSELFQQIREKNGLAYTVYSSHQGFRDQGLFSIYFATSHSQVLNCLNLIREVLEKHKETLLTSEQLKTVKNSLKGAFLLQADNVENRMNHLGFTEIYDQDEVDLKTFFKRLDDVSAEDLKRVARKTFQEDQKTLLALGPRPPRNLKKRFMKF